MTDEVILAAWPLKGAWSAAEIAPRLPEAVHLVTLGKRLAALARAGVLEDATGGTAGRAYRLLPPARVRGVKEAARAAVQAAVRAGRLTRPEACEECGTEGRVDGHHVDYARPLDVEWLCKGCHHSRHPQLPDRWF